MSAATRSHVDAFHECLRRWSAGSQSPADLATVDAMLAHMERPKSANLASFMNSQGAWSRIRNAYNERDPNAPFLDYFWSLRMMHGPIFQLARIADAAPDARIYHTVSTGYAGFLAALLSRRRPGVRVVLSEHGIYTKERQIDLNSADWLDPRGLDAGASGPLPSDTFRAIWVSHFAQLGRITYRASNRIVSLYEGNRQRQLRDGAPPERTQIIVNGVDTARFRGAREKRPQKAPPTVGFIGRLVPIKDLKTFIRALMTVFEALPEARGLVVGGADEEPEYAEECKALAQSAGIAHRIDFLGHRDVVEIFPQLGVLMLSSISEAQPLAVLEAFASGVPCVTTDVGACREQIEGRDPDDRALGLSGRVVGFADPAGLGRAVIELLGDEAEYARCQAAAIARVERFYDQRSMLQAYDELYREELRS
jgi:glycosyltransferase involved in cell wall biosynthesis